MGGSGSGYCDFGLELTFFFGRIWHRIQTSEIYLFILLNSDLKLEPRKTL